MRILVTGAAGNVASMTLPALEERYDLRLTDRCYPMRRTRAPFHLADVTDRATMARLMTNIDTVIHLAVAGYRAQWASIWPSNIVGLHNVLLAASTAGCRRVLFISSIQVVDGYPPGMTVPTTAPPRPINPYGISKVIGETMAHHFALQGAMSVFSVRIGTVLPRHSPKLHRGARGLERVITTDDLTHLLIAMIEASSALHYGLFHGLSANRHRRLDLTDTLQLLDYIPRDDAFALVEHNRNSIIHQARSRVRHNLKRLRSQLTDDD